MGFRADMIKPPTTLKAGDVLFMPAGTIHAAKNVGSDVAKELGRHIREVTDTYRV
jgi:quercetin dioxygenase-like cupin family protein